MNENDHSQHELSFSDARDASDASQDVPTDPARRRLAAGVGLAGLTLGGCNIFAQKPATPASQYAQPDRDGVTPLPTLPKIWGGLVPQAQEVDGKRDAITEQQIADLRNAPFQIRRARRAAAQLGDHARSRAPVLSEPNADQRGPQQPVRRVGRLQRPCNVGHYRNDPDMLKLWGLAQQNTLCDNFFMSAFGGSWLNHIFLISAQAPFYPNAANGPAAKLLAVVKGDDPTDPTGARLKLAPDSPKSERDGALTAATVTASTPCFRRISPATCAPRAGRQSVESARAAAADLRHQLDPALHLARA